jgi:hypothetical protein
LVLLLVKMLQRYIHICALADSLFIYILFYRDPRHM